MRQNVLPLIQYRRGVSSVIGDRIRQQRQAGRLGGQNLTERYARLAKSVRGKDSYDAVWNPRQPLDMDVKGNCILLLKTFYGLNIPERPAPPASEGE